MFNLSREDILHGDIIKGLIKLGLPLMFLSVINTLYGIVDTYYVGRIGELEVGAVSLISPITNCGVAFVTGLASAAIALISRSLGANDKEKANEIATHVIVMAIGVGVILTLLCLSLNRVILGYLKTPIDIYDDARNYLLGISIDYIFLFMLTLFQAIRQSSGDSKSGVIINVVASLLNVGLDPLFIFVFNLGTLGAALATVLSKALMTPIVFYLLIKDKEKVHISLRKYKVKLEMMINIIKVSIPASLGQLLQSFGFVLMSKEIVSYGSIAMSAYGVGSHVANLFYIPVHLTGNALTTFVGQALGNNDANRARKCFSKSLMVTVIICIVIIPIGFLSGRACTKIFVKNASDELIDLALEYFYYSVFTAFFMGWFNNECAIFNGSTNTKISMILSSSRILFVRMPIVYLLARYTNLGISGIWISMNISNLIICIAGQIIYRRYPWESKIIKV